MAANAGMSQQVCLQVESHFCSLNQCRMRV